ncbi:heat shock protein DnaJ domain protein [Rippkaea orientalis PCC 8801]|uniref:Heat shock protein DnaJ domain protein n=1 Tax=Rippkaea orientalis (strain PCC 8801 / RF-1) TaxID=41431 RepID=B7JVQ9_RIPO1|nr:DnaJ domain-containing protein [Rippkaea orientalis]ACK64630.1 heat shock protein DnaJ domain protein [Rippkaea orientalis PCC 8801]
MNFPIQQGLFKYDITDHYAILGLPLNADSKQIRKRYLMVARCLHPDTCKDKTEQGKKLANKLLSKLVNPAYELLSKEESRREYLLVLFQMGQNLAAELSTITLASDKAQQLFQATQNLDLVYYKLVNSLVTDEYSDLLQVLSKIAQLSELNLVYLMVKQGQQVSAQPKPQIKTPPQQPIKESEKTAPPVSAVDNSIRRAKEYLERRNTSQAIIELREALKIEPNNCTCHGLLGLAYLQEKQPTMAKIHINKAWKVNPNNPVAIKAKEALDKVLKPDTATPSKGTDKSTGGGLFGSLFGKKK